MSSIQTKGIVLHETDTGETDKRLTLLTKGYGKIAVSARGARKPKSKFMASAQLFTYSSFVIYDGGQFYSLSQADAIENFFSIRSDYTRLCLAQYFAELCDKTIPYNAPCDELLHLMIISLSSLTKGFRTPFLTARSFEIKFFQLSGVAPETERCAKCGGPLSRPFRFGADGTVCTCYTQPALIISPSALSAIRYILSADLPNIFKFCVGQDALEEMRCASRFFLKHHFDVNIVSLNMLE